jgi:hypothetical protein
VIVLLPCRVRLVFVWVVFLGIRRGFRACCDCLSGAGVLAEVLVRVVLPVRGVEGLV